MGFGLPSAIGAKAAKPKQIVLDIDSDGSMMMTGNEIASFLANDLPVIIALFDNRKYTLIRQVLKITWKERYIGEDIGEIPDFVKYAEAFKARAERITKPEEVSLAIKKAIKVGETTLLDIIIDPEAMLSCVWPPGKPLSERIEF
jgi:acetolactate synthase-1/2/3 large subunit